MNRRFVKDIGVSDEINSYLINTICIIQLVDMIFFCL